MLDPATVLPKGRVKEERTFAGGGGTVLRNALSIFQGWMISVEHFSGFWAAPYSLVCIFFILKYYGIAQCISDQ